MRSTSGETAAIAGRRFAVATNSATATNRAAATPRVTFAEVSCGVEWALRSCVTLSQSGDPVPAARLAELHGTPPAYLAKQLQALARAGIVDSTAGQVGGYTLTRPAAEITALDVVHAIDGTAPAYRCTEIRQRGPLALAAEQCARSCAIARAMAAVQDAWSTALDGISIADLAAGIDADSGGTALRDVRGG